MNTIEKWKEISTEDNILNKELKAKNIYLLKSFDSDISISRGAVSSSMGAGTNKINIHTIAGVASAYATFILKTPNSLKKVALCHDGTQNSSLFLKVFKNVLTNKGVKVIVFKNDFPETLDVLSFSIKKLGLFGGIMIGNFKGLKGWSGLLLLDNFGRKLSENDTQEIQKNILGIDLLNIDKSSGATCDIIPNSILEEYKTEVLKFSSMKSNNKVLKIGISRLSPDNGKLITDLFEKAGFANVRTVKSSKKYVDGASGNILNPSDVKSYDEVVSLSRKNKLDIGFVSNSISDKVGVVARYERRFKYLNSSQIASLYLDYKLNELSRNGNLPKDAFIIKSVVAGDLPRKIAEKFGVRVIDADIGLNNISDVLNSEKGTFILAYDESFRFLINRNNNFLFNSIEFMLAFSEAANFYKDNNINIFSHLKSIWKIYGVHRITKVSKKMDLGMTKRLMKNIKKIKSIDGTKVIKKAEYNELSDENDISNKTLKIWVENGSWFAISSNSNSEYVDIYIQTAGDNKDKMMNIVVFEKEIENVINENSESYPEKNISKRTIGKYLIFVTLMVITIYLVFKLIYAGTSTKGDTFSVAKKLFTSNSRFIFLIGFVSYCFPVFLHAFQKKRMISAFGQKVKWRHLAISAFMGTFVSWITPFAIGGDAIGYWFLRRKGFKRGPLAASFLTGTIIYQFQIVLVSSILLPMGIVMFHDQIFNGSAEMKTIIILFIIGACWNLFATFMIYLLTFNRKFQEWIVRTTIKLLEWLPFIRVQDPGRMAATYQFTFYEIRSSIKTIFKRKLLLLECTFYETVTSFVSFGVLVPILLGAVQPDLLYGKYFSLIVGSDVLNTANSYSITPGGSGTSEYIGMAINRNLFIPIQGFGNSAATATALDLLSKLTSWWPILLGSLLSILIIITGEKRRSKYKVINKNNRLNNIFTNKKTSFYLKISPLIIAIVITYFLLLFLIF